jgi:hypothetical protein
MRFTVLIAVATKIHVSWDVKLCQLANSYQHSGGAFYIHLQAQAVLNCITSKQISIYTQT